MVVVVYISRKIQVQNCVEKQVWRQGDGDDDERVSLLGGEAVTAASCVGGPPGHRRHGCSALSQTKSAMKDATSASDPGMGLLIAIASSMLWTTMPHARPMTVKSPISSPSPSCGPPVTSLCVMAKLASPSHRSTWSSSPTSSESPDDMRSMYESSSSSSSPSLSSSLRELQQETTDALAVVLTLPGATREPPCPMCEGEQAGVTHADESVGEGWLLTLSMCFGMTSFGSGAAFLCDLPGGAGAATDLADEGGGTSDARHSSPILYVNGFPAPPLPSRMTRPATTRRRRALPVPVLSPTSERMTFSVTFVPASRRRKAILTSMR